MGTVPGWVLPTICGVLGLLVGSFANVAIHRWPRRESVVRPPSRCPSCSRPIHPRDNVPIVSWFMLRGRCRHCDERISFRYPAVELLVAGLWVVVAVVHGPVWHLPVLLVVTWALVVVTFIDLEHRIIPNRLTFALAPLTLALVALAAAVDAAWSDFVRALLVGVGLPLGMLALSEIFRLVRGQAGMGMGDVKLAVSLGLVLGYLGGWYVVIALYATIISAVLIAIALMLAGRAKLASRIPFGPYLALGTLVAVLAGDPLTGLIRAWLGLA